MSASSHAMGSPDTFGYLTGYPSHRPPSSSEEEPSEDVGSEREISSQRSGTPSHSRTPVPLPPQPSPGGAYPRQTARMRVPRPHEAHYTLTDPYLPPAEGPSRVSDRYTWENLMRRSAGIEDPRVVAGVPVERTAGMTLDEFRQMQGMAAALHHCRARVDHQSQLMYETSEMLERVADYAGMAIVTANHGRKIIKMLLWLVLALGFAVLTLIVMLLSR